MSETRPQIELEQGGLEPGSGNPHPNPGVAEAGFLDHESRSQAEHLYLDRIIQGQEGA